MLRSRVMPALFTRISRRCHLSSTSLTMRAASPFLATSPCTSRHSTPNFADFFGGAFGLLGIGPEVQRDIRPAARKFKRDRPSDAARCASHQSDLTGERSRVEVSISFCSVCHFETPVFRIAADNCGINPHHHVSANRAGAKARSEDPHRTVNSLLPAPRHEPPSECSRTRYCRPVRY